MVSGGAHELAAPPPVPAPRPDGADVRACGSLPAFPKGMVAQLMAGRLRIAPFKVVTIDPRRHGASASILTVIVPARPGTPVTAAATRGGAGQYRLRLAIGRADPAGQPRRAIARRERHSNVSWPSMSGRRFFRCHHLGGHYAFR